MNLEFQFDSISDFIQMAGHGPYVWACYGLGVLCLSYLAISPLLQRRTLLNELQRTLRVEAHEKKQRQSAAQQDN